MASLNNLSRKKSNYIIKLRILSLYDMNRNEMHKRRRTKPFLNDSLLLNKTTVTMNRQYQQLNTNYHYSNDDNTNDENNKIN